MEIRMAEDKEILEILTHWKTVMSEATAGYLDPKKDSELTPLAPFFYGDFDYLVCLEDEKIQGWIGIGEIRDIYIDESKGFISELYVLPEHRNTGIGRYLCMEAIRRFKIEQYHSVQLNVFNGNHAKNLYGDLGFSEVSTLMELKLDTQ
ncbi:GNAT family N-acetyltransferase [Sporosarcina aquimarina]|uniref:GNAT family N-acetyltransferase n=1 Tax=Sporosarcina aquimarina TaxID=114975 RepID=A0ABU4FXL7_9BACL|nr:GNAT family N-acetyltransferase [Sporosarcina aquimarina]MDW0109440.1 GNAT family N-acetyltransferase [Sporosarcina aquimarina]